MKRIIKCPNCGTYNTNREFCSNCNAVLSYKKRRQLENERKEKERLKKKRAEEILNPSLVDQYKNHRFWIVRAVTNVVYSIWLGILAIGTFIAWLFTAIAA